MIIAVALICANNTCSMYLWPKSFATVDLCETFVESQIGQNTSVGLVTHVGCMDTRGVDEPV
jgi:hypothetical protein